MTKNKTKDKPTLITSADQLSEILKQPLVCKFAYKGQNLSVEVQPMTAVTAEKVRELRRKALPPFKRERGPNGSHDEFDPKYLEARETNDKKARALIVYTHCPAVGASKPGLLDTDQIYAHVQTLFTENILELISLTIQEGGLSTSIEERVDFTLAGGSES